MEAEASNPSSCWIIWSTAKNSTCSDKWQIRSVTYSALVRDPPPPPVTTSSSTRSSSSPPGTTSSSPTTHSDVSPPDDPGPTHITTSVSTGGSDNGPTSTSNVPTNTPANPPADPPTSSPTNPPSNNSSYLTSSHGSAQSTISSIISTFSAHETEIPTHSSVESNSSGHVRTIVLATMIPSGITLLTLAAWLLRRRSTRIRRRESRTSFSVLVDAPAADAGSHPRGNLQRSKSGISKSCTGADLARHRRGHHKPRWRSPTRLR